jgi:hypothetical protein
MVTDGKGNFYFTGRTKGFFDTTYGDVFVAQVKADGSLGWLKTFGGAKKDGFSKDGVYDPSSGTMAMIDIDQAGDLYIAANYNDDDNGVLFKLGSDGTAKWTTSLETTMPSNRHQFNAVSVSGGVAHVVGDRGIYAFDAASGSLLAKLAVGIGGGSKSRLLAIKATADGIYAGGWAGWSGDDDGMLVKFAYAGGAYSTNWQKRVPLSRGSKFSALDVAADGSLYAGVNIAGAANVSAELQKWSPAGALTWVRRYGDSPVSRTNVVKVVGNQVVVAGMTHHKGSATFTDPRGDGLLITVNADGSLAREHYYFTGTNPLSIDEVKGVAAHNGSLYAVFAHAKDANFGEWRNPADYEVLAHPLAEVDPSEYLVRDAALVFGALEATTSTPKDQWQDVTANAKLVEAAAGVAKRPADTDATYITAIPGYFGK